ncbi:MAG: hypothetical protein KDC44_05995 [Phaeodactylibacter sp.]|nr:hypothetical protein [Phaeodactylibacter sp.]
MKNRPIHKLLHDIEREVENDFAMLHSLGPGYFPTATLLELKGRCKEKLLIYDRLHRLGVILGASSPIWLVLGCIFGALSWYFLASLILFLFPVSVCLFVLSMVLIQAYFGGRDNLEGTAQIVEAELNRRQDALAGKRSQS